MIAFVLLSQLFISIPGSNSTPDIPSWLSSLKRSDTYIRPVPDNIISFDPLDVNDLFSYASIFQMHAALFRLDINAQPEPHLVASFSVSRDQLTYSFKLKSIHFHDNTFLKAKHVIYSLSRAIKSRVNNAAFFQRIKGYEDFLSGKDSSLKGLKVGQTDSEFTIELTAPDPELVFKLTDIRFAVLKDQPLNPKHPIGIGPYAFVRHEKGKYLHLKRFAQKELQEPSRIPEHLYFVRLSPTLAYQAFRSGLVDDLFFYVFFGSRIEALKSQAHFSKVFFPRSYAWILNSRRLKNLDERNQILHLVDREELVRLCYPGEKPSQSLVPPGYAGHVRNDEPTKKKEPSQISKKSDSPQIEVLVIESIGSEECVVEELQKRLGRNARVRVGTLSEFVERWRNNTLDSYFTYIEGETTVTYFGSLNPDNAFPLGDVADKKFHEKFNRFEAAIDPETKDQFARELAEHILGRGVILPIFHSTAFMIYQKRFQPLPSVFSSAALTPLTFFQFSKGAK